MHKHLKTMIILLALALIVPIKAKAAVITDINDLIENAKELDGQEITIQGEAIGESMDRGEYSWINLNDKTNAIGVWIKTEEAAAIKHYGDYKNIGATVQITGTFYRACPEHGGEADVHASSMNIVGNGHQVKEKISSFKVTGSIVLFIAALLLFLSYTKEKRARN